MSSEPVSTSLPLAFVLAVAPSATFKIVLTSDADNAEIFHPVFLPTIVCSATVTAAGVSSVLAANIEFAS